MLTYAASDGVARIHLDRPERLNAVSIPVLLELERAFDAAERDPSVRVCIIAGNGRSFSSGWDYKEERQGEASPAVLREESVIGNRVLSRVWSSPVVSIAAVHGYCIGAGCELALACDLTIADETAEFRFPEIHLATVPIFNILVWAVGFKVAKHILLTGASLGAQECLRHGIVTEVSAPGAVEERAAELAAQLAAVPGPVLASFKNILNKRLETAGFREYVDFTTEAFTLGVLLRQGDASAGGQGR